MKKILFVLTFVVFAGTAFSQAPEVPSPEVFKTAEDYTTYHDDAVEAMLYILATSPLEWEGQNLNAFVVRWMTGHPDLSLTVHPAVLGGVMEEEYVYGSQMLLVYLSGMAMAAVNGETEEVNLQLAGAEAILESYEMIKEQEKSSALEKMAKLQKKGKLKDHINKQI